MWVAIYQPHDNRNQKFIIDTQKRERNLNLTVKIVIKSQGKRAKGERNEQELWKTQELNSE